MAASKRAFAPLLALTAPALPFAGEMADNFIQRNARILKTLQNAPRVTPGERVVTANAKNFIEKRAALQERVKTAAGVLARASEAAKGGLKTLQKHPVAGIFGIGALTAGVLAKPTLDALGEKIKDWLVPDNQRDKMMDEGALSFAKSVGKDLGTSTVGLFSDMVSKGLSSLGEIPANRARKSLFSRLSEQDDVLSQADPGALQEAYHTMVRFAPTLATDQNAVRSFLRESVLYGAGPNVVTIKQLADSENAVNPPPKGR